MRGNSFWAPVYSLSSLWYNALRSLGIALLLSIGVTLPTSIFVWTETGMVIAVEEYIEDDPIKMVLKPPTFATANIPELEAAVSMVESSIFTNNTYFVPSTVGLLAGPYLPSLEYYWYWPVPNEQFGYNYRDGIKDTQVFLVTNGFLENVSYWFNFEGNFSLDSNQILVSSQFIDYTYDVYGVTLEIGDVID
ncbi:MAG: hypothetical protein RTU92_15030, partial [Candidatus Thorarchaeota archaeon]